MRSEVQKIFDAHIRKTFMSKTDVMRFLMNHERKGLCLDNLCEQIRQVELRRASLTFDRRYYKETIRSVADMFCSACLKHAEEQALSSNERQRRISEAGSEAELDGMLEEWKKDGALMVVDRTKEADNGQIQDEEESGDTAD